MAELRNSNRVSYKATYNQISPRATLHPSNGGGTPLMRAVEKAAFIQALKIVPAELPILRKQTAGATGVTRAALSTAFEAIESLVKDRTASSTLNHAAAFSRIEPATLVL